MEIITRSAAVSLGLDRYFTGNPCKHGHVDERYVSSKSCVECVRVRGQSEAKKLTDARRNKEKQASYIAAYRLKNSESLKAKRREKYLRNREAILAKQAEVRAKNKEQILAREAERRRRNPETHRARAARFRAKNPEKVAEWKRRRESERLDTDPVFSLKHRVRCLLRNALSRRGAIKGEKTAAILGCSWDEFATHIERQFLPGMTWENRHLWHIDHIVPLATAKTEADVLALNHFTNLRPLWGEDNLAKRDKQTHLI